MLTSNCLVYKFNQILYNLFVADQREEFHKTMFGKEHFKNLILKSEALIMKYSRYYDIGLFILIDTTIVTNKLEVFVISLLLIWYAISSKMVNLIHQKLNQVCNSLIY